MINQELFDKNVEHLILQRRYSDSARQLLEKAAKEHRTRFRALLDTDLNDKRTWGKEINQFIQTMYGVSSRTIYDIVGSELDFQYNNLYAATKSFYVPVSLDRKHLADRILTRPLLTDQKGKVTPALDTSFENIGKSQFLRAEHTLREGLAAGWPQARIISEIVRTSVLTENQAKTLTITGITRADTLVKEELFEANKEVIGKVVFTAILDGRTSKTCAGLNGLVQPLEKLRYKPPLHWNCRSTLVPVLKDKDALLKSDSARLDKAALEKLDPELLDGKPPRQETLDEWLRRQPFDTRKRYLGSEEKVALWERGTVNAAETMAAQGPLSLAALRRRDNELTFYDRWYTRFLARPKPQEVLAEVHRPSQLVNSPTRQEQLRQLLLEDAMNASQALSLVEYRGTTLAGKRASRRSSTNEWDPRTQSFNPYTGEVQNTYYYTPDYNLLRERLDMVKASKVLKLDQKKFIEDFVDSLDGKLSVNQQTAVTENLRVLFERYEKQDKKVRWEDFPLVLRAEMNYSVQNTSRILDRRSRAQDSLFLSWTGDPEQPSVMIHGNRIPLQQLHDEKQDYVDYVTRWRNEKAKPFARALYYRRASPWRSYFISKAPKPDSLGKKLWANWREKRYRSKYYADDPTRYYLERGKPPPKYSKIIKDHIKAALTPGWYKDAKKIWKEGFLDYTTRRLKEEYYQLVDYDLNLRRKWDLFLGKQVDKVLSPIESDTIGVLQSVITQIATGQSTDYDALAIQIGKELVKSYPHLLPWEKSDLQSLHEEGSRILETLRQQKVIRVNSRGVVRRAVQDLDTQRPALGQWKDTVSREVQILDPEMLKLQDYNRRITVANRIGAEREVNRYTVVPGKKTYVDAKGRDSFIPAVTRSAFGNFDEKQIDGRLADALNWTAGTKFKVDPEFSSFFIDLVTFKDQRGRAAYYDDLNLFREEIVRRGDQGFGFMEVLRYYNKTGKAFTNPARIDSRGRIYYNGYLTPTGGEVIRPFLNSAESKRMSPEALYEFQINLGAIIGPGTEALTNEGRMNIFKRHEKDLLAIGGLIQAKTQRDRRIREFLEHPLVQHAEAEEIAKLARFALEYKRIHDHMGGDLSFVNQGDTVYRFRDSKGRGIYYSPRVFGKTVKAIGEPDYTRQPIPINKAQGEDVKELNRLFNKEGFKFEELEFDSKSRFGFSSPEQLYKWFTPEEVDKLLAAGFTVQPIRNVKITGRTPTQVVFEYAEPEKLKRLASYRTSLMAEVDASASAVQMMALALGDKNAAQVSNVLPTRSKQRIYDLVAQDVVSDPRYQELMERLGTNIDWETLAKGSKSLVMVGGYGAGAAGQTSAMTGKLAKALEKASISTVSQADRQKFFKLIDKKIKDAESVGAEFTAGELRSLRATVEEAINSGDVNVIGITQQAYAKELGPEVEKFVDKLTSSTSLVGPKEFKYISELMQEKLAERAPAMKNYVQFTKLMGDTFVKATKKTEIPWVDFAGRKFKQTYRPAVQAEIRFYDPVSKRYVRNIYQADAQESKLVSKHTIGRVRLGFGVNGTHQSDSSLVMLYHLAGRKFGVPTTTIHDKILL